MSLSDSTSIMVASPDINDTASRTAVRDRLGIAPDDIAVVAAGRVHRLSGHRFAVWAASILKIADLPVRLIIQDTGRYARDVAEFAEMTDFSEQLILAGAEWPVLDLLSAADIALFLDRDAPLPTIPADLPIVAPKGSPATGRNVSLVRPDNPRQIAQALLKIIESKPPPAVNDK